MVAEWQIKHKTLFLYGGNAGASPPSATLIACSYNGVMQERRRLGDVNSLFV